MALVSVAMDLLSLLLLLLLLVDEERAGLVSVALVLAREGEDDWMDLLSLMLLILLA